MEPMLGEIRAVAFPFAPRNWAICDGSLIAIRSNTALFSLLGTQYGGDGVQTFALPDLRGRAVVNAGRGPGLSPYAPGTRVGTETVTLTGDQLPAHTHSPSGMVALNSMPASTSSPAGNYLANSSAAQYGEGANDTMAANSVTGSGASVGDNQAHENRQPFLVLNYVIALQGVYPSRP